MISVQSPNMSPKRTIPSSITPRSPQKSYIMSTPTSPSSSLTKRTSQSRAATSPAGPANPESSSFATSTWPRSPNRPIGSSAGNPRAIQPVASSRSPKNTLSFASSRSSGVAGTGWDPSGRVRTPSGGTKSPVAQGLRSASPDAKKVTTSAGNSLFSVKQTMNF